MIGSPPVAWLIAHAAFWILLAPAARDRRWLTIAVMVTPWTIGYVVSVRSSPLRTSNP